MVFLPAFLDEQKFYLTLDYHFLVSSIKGELAYIHRHWRQLGRPVMTLLITHEMLDRGEDAVLGLVQELQDGLCGDVPVKVGQLSQLILTAGRDRLDFLPELETLKFLDLNHLMQFLQVRVRAVACIPQPVIGERDDFICRLYHAVGQPLLGRWIVTRLIFIEIIAKENDQINIIPRRAVAVSIEPAKGHVCTGKYRRL